MKPSPASNIVHRVTGDGTRTACGKPSEHLYWDRFVAYMRAFCARHPEMSPCAVCWRDTGVTT